MEDDKNIMLPRQPRRGSQNYIAAKKEVTSRGPKPAQRRRRELWDVHFKGYEYEGGGMIQNNGLDAESIVEMVFKPKQFGRLLRPAESQLILAYMRFWPRRRMMKK